MMDLKRIFFIAATVVLLVSPSCKKKEENTDVDPSLNGKLSFAMPSFVLPGETYTLVPKGASNPTGDVGYAWSASWTSSRDTVKRETTPGDGSWTITTPSTTGSYTIFAYAFAEDYVSLTATKDFSVVDPTVNGTLTGAGYNTDSLTFKDSRDGGTYFMTKAGDNVWMQNNLYYNGTGVSYENSPAVDPIVGRLYTWNDAINACPDGWHLPSDAEFVKLAGSFVEGSTFSTGETFEGAAGALMANVYFNGIKMWAFWPNVNITNQSRFSAVPVGYAIDQKTNLKFSGINSYAVFWTSDNDGDNALYRYIYVDKNNVFCSKGDKTSFMASVRCVKD